MWRVNTQWHSPDWQWCHEQQVLWIHLEQREGGKKPLKSLTHHKRRGRWGDEFRGEKQEIWAISQFFPSVKAGCLKEKQVWMSLKAMVTVKWPLAEGRQCDRKAATTVSQKSTITTQYGSTCVPRALYPTAQGLTQWYGWGSGSTALCWRCEAEILNVWQTENGSSSS